MTSFLIASFWLSFGLVVYAYVGFPIMIWLAARCFGRGLAPASQAELNSPTVSVLIAALNEEGVIRERLENALACDYPPDRHEVVIASDGSTDRTAEIVREFESRHPGRVRLLNYAVRRGKATVLNDSLPQLTSEIVVLSDANTFFDTAAIRSLTRWFAEPNIGAVCGKLLLIDPHSGRNVDGLYWRYENFLKRCEGRLGALLGSNGAIYAIRRSEYVPIATDTIIDDFTIPLLIRLRYSKQIVYDEEAIAKEETPADVRDEFRRRSRIGAGGFQSLARLWPLLLPGSGWISFAFWSHKVLRWLCPAFLAICFIANVLLVALPAFRWLLGLQIAFYLAALIGALAPGNGKAMRILRLTTMFASMNLALAVGFWRWLSGMQRGTWQRTTR